MTDLKKEAAKHAMPLIKNHMILGLGAGSTIAYLADMLSEEIRNGLAIKIVTSSFTTRQLLQKHGFNVLPIASLAAIDLYIDGCDQLDSNLNALKSGGGIHTQEKLLACMAKQFILAGDEAKLVDSFDKRFPLVADILPEALQFATAKIQMLFPGVLTVLRTSDKKDGAVVTDNGNYLVDIWFKEWPELSTLNATLKNVTGIIETSLFYNLAHKAIIAGKDGIHIIEKNENGEVMDRNI